jgi:hypothetical protein
MDHDVQEAADEQTDQHRDRNSGVWVERYQCITRTNRERRNDRRTSERANLIQIHGERAAKAKARSELRDSTWSYGEDEARTRQSYRPAQTILGRF